MNEFSRLGLAWVALPQRLAVFGAIWLAGAFALTGIHVLWPPTPLQRLAPWSIERPVRTPVFPGPSGGGAFVAVGKAQTSMVSTASIQGAEVLDISEKKIGVVSDVLVSQSNGSATAVVRIENRTGVPQKDIAIPLSALKFKSSGAKNWAVIDLSKKTIESDLDFKVVE